MYMQIHVLESSTTCLFHYARGSDTNSVRIDNIMCNIKGKLAFKSGFLFSQGGQLLSEHEDFQVKYAIMKTGYLIPVYSVYLIGRAFLSIQSNC